MEELSEQSQLLPRTPPPPANTLSDASSPCLVGLMRCPHLRCSGAPLSAASMSRPPWRAQRPGAVSVQEHVAIDYAGLSLPWPLLLRSTGSGRAGSAAMAHGPSRSVACGIFPDRGTNPCPLHRQVDSQPLHHQGSPTLLFDTDSSTLHCTAHRAKGLKPLASDSVDTYVKANLLPGASKPPGQPATDTHGSGHKGACLGGGTHGFTLQDTRRNTLWLCVWEDPQLQQRRRAPPLRERRVPLGKLVPNQARSFDVCLERRRLVEAEVAGEERGLVLLSLCYSSQRGSLLVGVLRCAPLAPMDANGYSDPFVRLYLHPNGGKKSKYKTSVQKKTLNPEFNKEFFCTGPREELVQKTLLVSVWDYDLGTADDFTGGVQLSSQASGEHQQHWREGLGRTDHQLEPWHPLDGARSSSASSGAARPGPAHRPSPKLTRGRLHGAARTWGCLTHHVHP
ncbi:double C2-like domain-containing protein gamma [Globicephala melas]|uniref:double C2-like domain-containing protein gamma n=1 Tax=Globicephala melas TaxID=9731 RepID=UPI00293D5416|nr:double C2-like domain-containing protein gamma [Globicephala melas]